uniref:Fe2OG dioxygenase domain-containing protein n=1 Tax=viral metagenome TaxID=1070528 RepID=A0A6C0CAB3_9ZZZZ
MSKNKHEQKCHNLTDGGQVVHVKNFIKNPTNLFNELKSNAEWEKFTYKVYDKKVQSPRLMAIIYFDDTTLTLLDAVRLRVEKVMKLKFKYAVLNYYKDGNDYISYHADREVPDGTVVVSISLGATRRFILKHKYDKKIKYIFLPENGDLLVMNDVAIKKMYKHSVPKMANVGARISVTLRQ